MPFYSYGVWNGQAWLLTVFHTIWRCETIDEAETLAQRQRETWPDMPWTVYLIGSDDKPYKGNEVE